jgi:hypothetical protein
MTDERNPQARAKLGMPDGWRDVPMPRGVAALPRTKGGIPITFTVAWSSETGPVAREGPAAARAGRPPVCRRSSTAGRQGHGMPKLAVSDVARTRAVVLNGLCQACGRRLPGRARPPWRQHPRWLCDLRNRGQEIRIGFRTVPLIVDGWTCAPCLTYALRVCPGLVLKRVAQGDARLRLLRVRDCEFVATLSQLEGDPAWLRDAGLDRPVVEWVKIAPPAFDVVTPEEFLAEHGAAT